MSEDFDPCKACGLKEREICSTCEYGILNEEQRRELVACEYYGED